MRMRLRVLVAFLLLNTTACSSRQAGDAVARWTGREAARVAVKEAQSATSIDAGVPADCAAQVPPSGIPVYTNPKMTQRTAFVCRAGYTVLHSGVTRTPLWSAEALTPERVASARTLARDDAFHPEPSVAVSDRAELPDYVRSGYDRGHLAPSGDMPTAAAQAESFSLANIAPQAPRLNRGAWEQLESTVRQRALAGPVFVITGVAFRGASVGFLKGRVAVPTEFYKLVYDPASREAAVFVASNQETGTVEPMDVAAFETLFGIRFNLGAIAPLHLGAPSPRHARRRS